MKDHFVKHNGRRVKVLEGRRLATFCTDPKAFEKKNKGIPECQNWTNSATCYFHLYYAQELPYYDWMQDALRRGNGKLNPKEVAAFFRDIQNVGKKWLDRWKGDGNLTIGDHNVDCFLHVRGTVRKGKDYVIVGTASIPIKQTLALFIKYSGVTREAAKSALVKAMNDAAANGDKVDMGDLDKEIEAVTAMLPKLPPISSAGKTTVVSLTVERIPSTLVSLSVRDTG